MANFPEYNLKIALALILCFEGLKSILMYRAFLKNQKSSIGRELKPEGKLSVNGERFCKTIRVEGQNVKVEIFVPEALRESPTQLEYFAQWVSNYFSTLHDAGIVLSRILIHALSETEAICTYYDSLGAEVISRRISAAAKQDAYSVGKTYLEQLTEKGTYDPRILAALQDQLEKKFKNRETS